MMTLPEGSTATATATLVSPVPPKYVPYVGTGVLAGASSGHRPNRAVTVNLMRAVVPGPSSPWCVGKAYPRSRLLYSLSSPVATPVPTAHECPTPEEAWSADLGISTKRLALL